MRSLRIAWLLALFAVGTLNLVLGVVHFGSTEGRVHVATALALSALFRTFLPRRTE